MPKIQPREKKHTDVRKSFITEGCELRLGDGIKMLEGMPDSSVDLILTDPPYGHKNNDGDMISVIEKLQGRGRYADHKKIAEEVQPERPILNDGDEANDLYKALLQQAKRVLKKGGGVCCCCCGGGGPDPQFARWSMWMNEALTFNQMVIWDKGPLGLGWHYHRSYETVLVGYKGTKCNWYDKTRRVENIIRPIKYGVRKIIPRGGRPGLDSTCTVKLECLAKGDLPCNAELLVDLLQKVTSGSSETERVKWSTGGCGESIMVRCRSDFLSTTLMEISKITESRISALLMHLPTRDYIVGATRTQKVTGGNPAENAGKQKASTKSTTKSVPKADTACRSVSSVAFDLLSRISDTNAWQVERVGAEHPCEKPVMLAEFFIELHTRPGDLVVDPFTGRGWAGAASIRTGRRFMGSELDPHWFDEASKRLAQVAEIGEVPKHERGNAF